MKDRTYLLLAALLVGAGLAIGGWFIGDGFVQSRIGDRYVTVKGISERTVKANLALWPMRFVATGNDLTKVQAKISADAQKVITFLTDQGVPRKEIELQSLEVTDLLAQAYRSPGPVESRFIVAQTLMVRSNDVDRIAQASQKISELVDAGVVLSNQGGPGGGGPYYLFTGLTQLKPAMIGEATHNARMAAEQFAKDSGAVLGGIRRANQGLFQILARDNAPQMVQQKQIEKTVRVVSTLQYYLAK